jgi:hypothetical protein
VNTVRWIVVTLRDSWSLIVMAPSSPTGDTVCI